MFTKQAEKLKETSARMLMAAVFWNRKGVLMVEFMQQGATMSLRCIVKHYKDCVGQFIAKGVACICPL
jgi:hypothetical protein